MTVSILTTLAAMPSGASAVHPLTLEELGKYLGTNYDTTEERERNKRHCLRDELYRDGGAEFMETVIDSIFDDADVRRRRKKMIPFARFNNPVKRVVNEIATVYADPAKRAVDGDANNAKYQALLERVCINEQMFQFSRLLNLHRTLLVRFRARELPDGTREPVLDHATPAHVRAVLHPNDASLVVGWLIKTAYRTARPSLDVPCWTLWTDHERIQLRDDLTPITASYVVHGLGINPWIPVSLSPPVPGFWPGNEGADLDAAMIATWIQGVLLLKESKDATKMTVISGDGTQTARGQSMDTASPTEIADGQSISTVDMGMDLDLFRSTADHIIEHVAQNYGLSAALINHQGVQSAEARELMRAPLYEIRKHQQGPLRRFEHALANAMVAVLAIDMPDVPEYAFSTTGWNVVFAQSTTPLPRAVVVDTFIKERAAGLDNTLDMIIRDHPGMTEEQAQMALERNIEIETARNVRMRPMQAVSGGGVPTDPNVAPDANVSPDPTSDATSPS